MFGSLQWRRALVPAGVVAVLAILVIAFWMLTRIDTERTYRIGTRGDTLSPTAARDGRVDSLGVAVVAEAARRAGVRLQWIDSPEGPDEAFRNKRIDLWPMLTMLPERKQKVHISDAWISSERCLITRGKARTSWRGIPVAYGLGSTSRLSGVLSGAVPLYAGNEIAAMQMMCTGQAAAAFVTLHSLGALALRRPPGCESTSFEISSLPATSQKSGVGSTHEAARVADRIRSQIGQMAMNGILTELFQRFGIYGVTESHVVYELTEIERRSRLLTYGASGLAAALGVLIWQMRRVRQSRKMAEHANRVKSEFLANMSHEIRTPLNGIAGMIEILGHSGLSADQREMLDVMQLSSESLITIVNDILDLSKIEAGAMHVEEVAFDLRFVVEGVGKLLTHQAKSKRLVLEVTFNHGTPRMVKGDPLRLRQVLLNLASNAIKFTEKGSVRIEVSPAGEESMSRAVLFRVIDTGIGIDPNIAERLFDPFTQAESATTRKYGGTGLGLTISRRLVMLMGGSIGVESAPGRGSTFWFVIPMEAAPEKHAPAMVGSNVRQAASMTEAKMGHILVVEDNPVNQLVAAKAIRHLGYDVTIAASGYAALEMLADSNFDLIFMDCQMPDLDGYQTTREIRRREDGVRRTPIVAMTANSIEGDQGRCAEAGMDGYLGKPLRIATLAEVIEQWIKEPELCGAGASNLPPASPRSADRPSDR